MRYNCTRCLKGSDFENDNILDSKSKVVCSACVRATQDETFCSFAKHSDGPVIQISRGEIRLWYNAISGCVTNAWMKHGTAHYGKVLGFDYRVALDAMIADVADGVGQCTSCKQVGPVGNLRSGTFAAMLCPICHADWQARCLSEKESGHVCAICHAARSACCC